MKYDFLLYGANGFVGKELAPQAVQQGFRPLLAGRNEAEISALAKSLGLDYRVFSLEESEKLRAAVRDCRLVLHCAGPYIYTFRPMVEACIQEGVHYLDITGEMGVYIQQRKYDAQAKERGVMILPAVGFDVVPTDCLALYLKEKLPSATHLQLAFSQKGPAKLPPGTAKTMIEMMHFGLKIRRDGKIIDAPDPGYTQEIDFGNRVRTAIRLNWGDVFTAYYTTGIPNIENFIAAPKGTRQQSKLLSVIRPLSRFKPVRRLLQAIVKAGSTAEERSATSVHVWGKVWDDAGNIAEARLHGPEAGVVWTIRAALVSVRHVLAGEVKPGFQTPAGVFGADVVLECEGVVREDVQR